jgi:hypothetical protein
VKSNTIGRFTNGNRSENSTQNIEESPEGLGNRFQATRKPGAPIQISNQRLFGPKAAARYLGICEDTLKKITDLEQIPAFNLNGRRAYRIEDLERFIESLPGWYDDAGEKSAKVVEKGNHDL